MVATFEQRILRENWLGSGSPCSQHTRFRTFLEQQEYDSVLAECADYIVEHDIDLEPIYELTELVEGIGSTLGAVTGGALGTLGGGPIGTVGGAMGGAALGGKIDRTVGKWMGKGKAQQLAPAYQQATQAVDGLVQALNQAGGQEAAASEVGKLLPTANKLKDTLQQIGQSVPNIDQSLKTQHDTQAKQAGGLAQKTQAAGENLAQKQGWLGKVGQGVQKLGQKMAGSEALSKQAGVRGAMAGMGDKWQAFAQKHPKWAQAMKMGGIVGTSMLAGKALGGLSGAGAAGAGGAEAGGAEGTPGVDPGAGADAAGTEVVSTAEPPPEAAEAGGPEAGGAEATPAVAGGAEPGGEAEAEPGEQPDNRSFRQRMMDQKFAKFRQDREILQASGQETLKMSGVPHGQTIDMNGDGVPDNPQTNYFNKSDNTFYGPEVGAGPRSS